MFFFLRLTPKVNSGMAARLRRKSVYTKNLLNPLLVQHTHTAYVLVALVLSYTCVLRITCNSDWFKSYEILKFALSIVVRNHQCHVFPLCKNFTLMVCLQYSCSSFFAKPLIRTFSRSSYEILSHITSSLIQNQNYKNSIRTYSYSNIKSYRSNCMH